MSRSRSICTSAKWNRSSIQGAISSREKKRTNSTVESRGAAAVDTIFPEGFNRTNFDSFVASETHEVIANKIQDLLACVDEFRPGSICTRNDGHRGEIRLFFWGETPMGSGVHSSTSSSISCWMVRRETTRGGQTFSEK